MQIGLVYVRVSRLRGIVQWHIDDGGDSSRESDLPAAGLRLHLTALSSTRDLKKKNRMMTNSPSLEYALRKYRSNILCFTGYEHRRRMFHIHNKSGRENLAPPNFTYEAVRKKSHSSLVNECWRNNTMLRPSYRVPRRSW